MLAGASTVLLVGLAVAAGITLVIVLGVVAHRAAVRRREAFEALARRLGWAYRSGDDREFHRRYPQFECLQRGHSRRAFNLLHGPIEVAPDGGQRLPRDRPPGSFAGWAGEYEFRETTGSGKNRRTVTYRFGFLIVETPWSALPDLLLRREHFFDKVAGFMGFDDIDFESAEFSRRYMVKSRDKRFAYDLIDARMMEFLLDARTPMIDMGLQAVCLWGGPNARLDPPELEALIAWAREFLARWPRMVVARLDGERIERAGGTPRG